MHSNISGRDSLCTLHGMEHVRNAVTTFTRALNNFIVCPIIIALFTQMVISHKTSCQKPSLGVKKLEYIPGPCTRHGIAPVYMYMCFPFHFQVGWVRHFLKHVITYRLK